MKANYNVLLAIMSPMTNSRTLRTTTQRASQTAGSTLKNILPDVLGTSPGE